ncbi:type VI lipase adapter Tla3 domain-containing protein [Janthinobacterium sp. LB2P70]|uniref:type VI lipase adapter Tla3 domain-containing protein n=1 Tax=Janthinobacterium sp. LB2P70 TaxID=3424197 RepID=UPI003F249872
MKSSFPRLRYPLGAAFIALAVLGALLISPSPFLLEPTMSSKIWWYLQWLLLIPPVVAATLLGSRWLHSSKPVAVAKPQVQLAAPTEQEKREYVLEVIGLGVTLDKYRQGKLWEALQTGNAYTSIREQDKRKYPWSSLDKAGTSGGRAGDSLENGALNTPMYFAVPIFNAEGPIADPALQDTPHSPIMGLAGSTASSGMHWLLFVAGPRRFAEHPEHILEDVFAFFDAHPDVPYVILNSHDGMESRDINRSPNTPELLKDGYYIPEMPDASAMFVLARRERIDAVRKFAYDDAPPEDSVDDLNTYGVARRLYLAYDELMRAVPHPRKKEDPTVFTQRQPSIAEWLPVAAQFAQRPDIRGTGSFSMVDRLKQKTYHPPKDWQPTPWLPLPFNKEQLAQLDRLPTFGFIHRPTFVKMKDEHGKPLTRRDQRELALQTGWQQALRSLPEAERPAAPARLVAATGGNQAQLLALHKTVLKHAENGGTELDSGNTAQWIDTDQRLGNTGAATLFVQMAIGVMGSYRDGGVSAVVNLRNPDEATIVLVSPPSDEKRRTQKHPHGGDVLRHYVTPAIDPANYPSN